MIRRTAICIAACVLTFGNALHADPYREVFKDASGTGHLTKKGVIYRDLALLEMVRQRCPDLYVTTDGQELITMAVRQDRTLFKQSLDLNVAAVVEVADKAGHGQLSESLFNHYLCVIGGEQLKRYVVRGRR